MVKLERIVQPESQNIAQVLSRPSLDSQSVKESVSRILDTVRSSGDSALVSYAKEFDHAEIQQIMVPREKWCAAAQEISSELKSAINRAKQNIELFHASQKSHNAVIEVEPGVTCWQKSVPLRRVGLYVPGGNAPLFSTVLMLAIPASIAGCEEIILATPPKADGSIDPAILYAASISGVTAVIASGGAQAIAALAYGTESVPAVDKILGPGNRFVTEAKLQVAARQCAIDMPAGPSEVMVVVDERAQPSFVAADLLSQAEHGPDSQSILVVYAKDTSAGHTCIDEVESHLSLQLEQLMHKEHATASLAHAKAVIVTNIPAAADVINTYAPEHLILNISENDQLEPLVRNAGSVFLGEWACESLGDYASGTNHTLPTAGWARSYSGVSLDSYLKQITFQRVSSQGLQSLGPVVETLAQAESLEAHAQAVSVRLKKINEGKL